PPRPPLPPRVGAPVVPPGYPSRPRRAPWPEAAERAIAPRPSHSEDLDELYRSPEQAPLSRPQPPARPPQPQRGGPGERGPLVESIPRRMRAGTRVSGEVRVARDKIETLMRALTGSVPHRPGAHLARVLSVRLRAPNGGFLIEATSPETQWIESNANLVHDAA